MTHEEKKDFKEYILRYMKVPAKKKLEWLKQMHDFTCKFATKDTRKNWWRLRETR